MPRGTTDGEGKREREWMRTKGEEKEEKRKKKCIAVLLLLAKFPVGGY